MKPFDSTGLKRLHREWRRKNDTPIHLLLDSVQTPYNVGTIIRTAAAYRVDTIWCAGRTESPNHAKTNKTALGSQRFVTLETDLDIDEAIARIKGRGIRLVGVELAPGARPAHEADLTGELCLAVGHEDRGLSAPCLAACDDVIYLPQLGRIGSLNVGVAASIALYEARRQQWG
ncbi:MAG: TrmH family RNA methyltransferase [Acidimicrobiales bacterium]|nr:TrmH family RNA methyltransferase [Acidimicrobiales bacterium]